MTTRVFSQEEVFLMEVNMTPDLTKTQFHPKKSNMNTFGGILSTVALGKEYTDKGIESIFFQLIKNQL